MASILAIHAHPDDVELLIAGTLTLLAKAGHRVAIVTATAGEGGAIGCSAAETAAIRRREAAASAALIGARYECLGLPDLGVFNDDPARRAITGAVRAAAPDLVLAPSPADYHPDHEAVSALARDACFAAAVPNYPAGAAPPLDAVPHLYFVDPVGGRDREGARVAAEFGVDIGEVMATKRAMLACHASQVDWEARQHAIADPVAEMEAWSRRRGAEFGAALRRGPAPLSRPPVPANAAAAGNCSGSPSDRHSLDQVSSARPGRYSPPLTLANA